MAYFLGISPIEFWNTKYREIKLFCEMGILRINEDFKKGIELNEATTDKLIQSNPLLNKTPKIVSLKKHFPKLFDKKQH